MNMIPIGQEVRNITPNESERTPPTGILMLHVRVSGSIVTHGAETLNVLVASANWLVC